MNTAAVPAGAMHSVRWSYSLWLFLGFVTVSALMVHLASDDVAVQSCAWGTAIVVTGLVMSFHGDHPFDMFSPKFFVGIVFVVMYGVGAMLPFLLDTSGGLFSQTVDAALDYYPQATCVSFFCLVAFWFGYQNEWVRRHGQRSRLLQWGYRKQTMSLLWCVLTLTGFVSYVALLEGNAFFAVTEVVQSPLFLSAAGFFLNGITGAITISLALAVKNRSIPWGISAAVAVLAKVLLGVLSGSKIQALVGLIFAALAWNYAVRAFSRSQAAIALASIVAMLVLLMPLSVMYREALLEQGPDGDVLTTAVQQASNAVEGFRDAAQDALLLGLAKDYAAARLSSIVIVASILRYQDEGGQLHYGGSYARMLLVLIPRFVWPEKPLVTIGGRLNVEVFGAVPDATVLGEEITITSAGVTMVGELIYNFPPFVAPLGAILIGMFFRWIYEVFRAGLSKSLVIAVTVYANWWFIFIYSLSESNWAASFNGLITYTAFLFVLFWLLGMRPLLRQSSNDLVA